MLNCKVTRTVHLCAILDMTLRYRQVVRLVVIYLVINVGKRSSSSYHFFLSPTSASLQLRKGLLHEQLEEVILFYLDGNPTAVF